MLGRLVRRCAVAALVSGMAACTPVLEEGFWDQASPFVTFERFTERGLAEMAKGNYPEADRLFGEALARDPQDFYALLWRGILYQNTNQIDKARDLYRRLQLADPPGQVVIGGFTDMLPKTLSDVAELNLIRLNRGEPAVGMAAPMVAAAPALAPSVPGMPQSSGLVMIEPSAASAPPPTAMVPDQLTAADRAIAQRFAIMRALQDEGLVTPEEYAERRQANLGALLPMSAPPAADGLTQPPPDGAEVVRRLEALNRSLRLGAVSVQEHMDERGAILDALMPAVPTDRAAPLPAPQGLMDAARRIARLDALRDTELLTDAEVRRERDAIEAAIVQPPSNSTMIRSDQTRRVASRPATADISPAGAGNVARAPAASAPAAAASSGPNRVHLASYRSEAQARQGWAELRGRFGSILGAYQPEYESVSLPRKGRFVRLLAGRMSASEAGSVCTQLKRSRQYCDVMR